MARRCTPRAEASCCWVRCAWMRKAFKTDPKEEGSLSIKAMGHTPFWHVLLCPGMRQRMSHALLYTLNDEQEKKSPFMLMGEKDSLMTSPVQKARIGARHRLTFA